MSSTRIRSHKSCFVPTCGNTTRSSPRKEFLIVPRGKAKRKIWCESVGHPDPKSLKPTTYICEDHFDFQADLENYSEYKLLNCKKILKEQAVPRFTTNGQKLEDVKFEENPVLERHDITQNGSQTVIQEQTFDESNLNELSKELADVQNDFSIVEANEAIISSEENIVLSNLVKPDQKPKKRGVKRSEKVKEWLKDQQSIIKSTSEEIKETDKIPKDLVIGELMLDEVQSSKIIYAQAKSNQNFEFIDVRQDFEELVSLTKRANKSEDLNEESNLYLYDEELDQFVEEISPKTVIQRDQDRRCIIQFDHFFKKIKELDSHNPITCSFKDMKMTRFLRNGLATYFNFECEVCQYSTYFSTEEKSPNIINEQVIKSCQKSGTNQNQLQEIFSSINIPLNSVKVSKTNNFSDK